MCVAGQAGGKKTKYLLGFSAPDQSDVLSDSVSFNKSIGKIGFFFIKNRENLMNYASCLINMDAFMYNTV